jgi:hypothetical protein
MLADKAVEAAHLSVNWRVRAASTATLPAFATLWPAQAQIWSPAEHPHREARLGAPKAIRLAQARLARSKSRA